MATVALWVITILICCHIIWFSGVTCLAEVTGRHVSFLPGDTISVECNAGSYWQHKLGTLISTCTGSGEWKDAECQGRQHFFHIFNCTDSRDDWLNMLFASCLPLHGRSIDWMTEVAFLQSSVVLLYNKTGFKALECKVMFWCSE